MPGMSHIVFFFFFKQKTAYEISTCWSSDVCSSDLRQYFQVRGGATQAPGVEPGEMIGRQVGGPAPGRKYKAIARDIAYHGTTFGALSINGVEGLRTPLEPLVPEVGHVSNSNRYHRPPQETEEEFTAFLPAELDRTILEMDPETV